MDEGAEMDTDKFSPEEALAILMEGLRKKSEELASEVQNANDSGTADFLGTTDKQTRPRASSRRGPLRPLSHEEAVEVALHVLQSYFIEQPLLEKSAVENLTFPDASEEIPPSPPVEEVTFEFDFRTETQMEEVDEHLFRLKGEEETSIEQQRQNLASLRELGRVHAILRSSRHSTLESMRYNFSTGLGTGILPLRQHPE